MMRELDLPVVGVVIPAYNAASTIDETLLSVMSQSYQRLDIVVVDDGSRDDTAAIAERHAAADPRIRVVRQANAGVAAARNHGASSTKADLLAFVDADDLWAPTKIELQVQALLEGGDDVGLAYCWFAVIDGRSVVTEDSFCPEWQGEVFDRLLLSNFVGNGSSVLVRRQAFADAGGFEPGLRAANAQGCEDYLFACRVAENYRFALVADHLIGYRYLPDNMSSDMAKMLRSWFLVAEEMLGRHPDKAGLIEQGLRSYAGWLVRRAVYLKQPRQLLSVLTLLLRRRPAIAAATMRKDLLEALGYSLRGAWARIGRSRHAGVTEAVGPDRRFPTGSLSETEYAAAETARFQ